MRLTVGDLKVRGKVDNTYTPAAAFDSTRLLIQLGVLRGARRTTKDVGGAYLFGTPTPPTEPGGRFLFVPAPPGSAEFGYPEKDERGRQNYFEVVGNLPGRQGAGRVWGECYGKFLLTKPRESTWMTTFSSTPMALSGASSRRRGAKVSASPPALPPPPWMSSAGS